MNRPAYMFLLLGIFLLAGVCSAGAQQINPLIPPPPPPAPSADTSAASATPPAHSAAPPSAATHPIDPTVPPPPPPEEEPPETPAEPSGPVFDPLHAQRSLEVGKFYLDKGVYDAAIDRFIEASNYQPSLASPWKYLGEAYEKKREYSKAVEAYDKYLDLLPHAGDAAKIKKIVSELKEKSAQESRQKAER